MGQSTRSKSHLPDTLQYNTIGDYDFDVVVVGGAIVTTTVSAFIAFPFNVKIFALTICQLTGANFATAVNIVVGVGAQSGTVVNDNYEAGANYTVATAGQSMFATAAGQTITGLAAGVPQTFGAVALDAIYPANTALTLRLVVAAAGGNIKVAIAYAPYDIQPTKPINAVFNPATDL